MQTTSPTMLSHASEKVLSALLEVRNEILFCGASAVVLAWLQLGQGLAELLGRVLIGVILPALGLGWVLCRVLRSRTLVLPHKKAVLITGCDRGFGNRLARRLDSLGFQVFAGCLNAKSEDAQHLKQQTSPRTHVFQLDVTRDEDIRAAVDMVKEQLGDNSLWGVVTNAGINVFLELEWLRQEDVKNMFDVNVHGTLSVVRAFLPMLRRFKGSRIVLVASQAGRIVPLWIVPYAMTKAAVIALADGLRRELCKWNVHVSTIEPYYYLTDINPKSEEEMLRRHAAVAEPVRAAYGSHYPQEAARSMVRFLQWASRTDIGEVTRAMEQALMQVQPERYYRCDGTLTWILHLLLFNLPSFFADVAVSTMFTGSYAPDKDGVLQRRHLRKTDNCHSW
ncbi:retinol dehydrogenase 7-like [Ornithodoros turicata]|uniref:retinol dehydrogenase 7-like n=1 Tax=Ornithodoros turicata TaxID=34597 RepID=UPI003139E28F